MPKSKPCTKTKNPFIIWTLHLMTAHAFGVPLHQVNLLRGNPSPASTPDSANFTIYGATLPDRRRYDFILNRQAKSAEPGEARGPLSEFALRNYAVFTQVQAKKLTAEEIPVVQRRMYRIARRMGGVIRCLLFIRSDEKARKVLFWLYRNIDIDLCGSCPGAVTVNHCYFSQYYTPGICRIMSAMDKGIFAGLFHGGTLSFQERITEGHACCQAAFHKNTDQKRGTHTCRKRKPPLS